MTKYNPVTPQIADALRQIVGASNVILDEEKLEAYSHDETPKDQFSGMPEVIVTPTGTQQVADIMKLANAHLIPVTPRGAGSGLYHFGLFHGNRHAGSPPPVPHAAIRQQK